MTNPSELLLTFLLNACWQIPLITVAATIGGRVSKRSPSRYQHWLWVSAMILSLAIPLLAALKLPGDGLRAISTDPTALEARNLTTLTINDQPAMSPGLSQETGAIFLNRRVAQFVVGLYVGILIFGVFRFTKACFATRAIRRDARPPVVNGSLMAAIAKCQRSIGTHSVEILSSESLPVPVTLGILRPVIIVPEQLLREGNTDLITSAIAHEIIHVARRDYLLNLAYELLYLPLSFHPAAALLRRRIKETRELSCDELVSDQVLEPDVYARSLVAIASAAPPVGRLSVNATVGIADADILEVRVMSLMNKPKSHPSSRKSLLIAVSMLLMGSSATAAAFALPFDVQPLNSTVPQDLDNKLKQKKKEKEKLEEELKSRELVNGTSAARKVAELRRLHVSDEDTEERARRVQEELKARHAKHAELLRLARVSMYQAIQIATSQFPGKVVHSSLAGRPQEKDGEMATVFYHVIVLVDEDSTLTHVWVNGIDGTIIRADKESPRK